MQRGERVIPFSAPSISDTEVAEVVRTLRSGWLTGPVVTQFETNFAAYLGADTAVAVNSGTAALHLALEAVGVRPADEVIVPTFTFTATAEVVLHLGARPVLADCRLDTMNIDVSTVEPLLTSRTRAIVPVHIAGMSCDMDPILDLARAYGLHVVEDAAHALPAAYKGRPVGTIGDVTAFSFHPTGPMTTGEGGMLTTGRAEYAQRARIMSQHGLTGSARHGHEDRGHWRYEVEDFGFKYNMSDLAATLGIVQLKRLGLFHKRRHQIALQYTEGLGDLDTCRVPRETGYGTHAWYLYIVQLNLPALISDGRKAVLQALAERGIQASVHFIPLHLRTAYQVALGDGRGAHPEAERLAECALSLPIYPAMSEADVSRVIESLRDVLRELRR
jgi:dTDP-4-amino-4,6-dideoxygalactose transaminase